MRAAYTPSTNGLEKRTLTGDNFLRRHCIQNLVAPVLSEGDPSLLGHALAWPESRLCHRFQLCWPQDVGLVSGSWIQWGLIHTNLLLEKLLLLINQLLLGLTLG